MEFEIKLIKFLQAGRNQFFDVSFQAISLLASVVGVVFFVLFLLRYKPSLVFWYAFAYGMVALLVSVLKVLVARERPFAVDGEIAIIGDAESDFSFPSGHTACAVTIAIFLGTFLFEQAKDKKTKFWITFSLTIYVLLVMISRMYLGMHYLTDILVGAAVPVIVCPCVLATRRYFQKKKGDNDENQDGDR